MKSIEIRAMEIKDPVLNADTMRDAVINGFLRLGMVPDAHGRGYTRPPGTCEKNWTRRKAERKRKKKGG
jgi:hypothetical protein